MSGAAELEDVYAAIEESARLLDVPCSRDGVWPILTAYGNARPEGAVILSVSTGTQECDYTIQVPPGNHDIVFALVSNTSTPTTFDTEDPIFYANGHGCPSSGRNSPCRSAPARCSRWGAQSC